MSKALILRTCDKDHKAYGGFLWPELGPVEAPDWTPEAKCGGGLHGLLWGAGDTSLVSHSPNATWKVVEVDEASIVDLGGKVKFPRGVVVYSGTRDEATRYIGEHGGATKGCHWISLTGGDESTLTGGNESTLTGGHRSTLTGGYRSTLTGGYRSTLTGGNESTLTGGYRSTLTGGYRSTLTGGNESTLTGGYRSTLTGGYRSTLTGGDESTLTGGNESTLTGGYRSTLTGGNESTLTGGYRSTLTGGYESTLTGGNESTLTGGDESVISAYWLDYDTQKYRRAVGLIGQDGLKPGVPYTLDDKGKWVEAQGVARNV